MTNKLQNAETETKTLKNQISKYGDYASQVLSDDNKARVQSAISKYENMSYEAAMDDLNRVLQDTPNSDVALYYKGMCYLKLSDENNATLVFNQLVENCPNSVYYAYACEHADDEAIQAGKDKAAQKTSAAAGTEGSAVADSTDTSVADQSDTSGTDTSGPDTTDGNTDSSYGYDDTAGADDQGDGYTDEIGRAHV